MNRPVASRSDDDPCDICGAFGSMTPLVEAGLPGVGPAWIHACGRCGFRQVRPRLPPAALDALYGADYFDTSSAHGFAEYARQRQRYERDAFFLARELRALRPDGGRLLEVGSALGFLLAALARCSDWRVEGVEVSRFGAWYARDRFGATVHHGTLEDAAFAPASFDYVVQKDLLEHVTHPRRHLQETLRILRPGGRLRLITPNGEADVRLLQRAATAAGQDELPLLGQGHLSFFTRPQLIRMLEETGFRLLRIRAIGLRRGLRALGVVPGWRSRAPLASRASLAADAASGASGASREAVSDAEPDAHADEETAARVDAEIARRHRAVRGWRPYWRYRRALKWFDALPPPFDIGQDFELLLERRFRSQLWQNRGL
ncbi:MAG: class I SAM-dependent methyltransferase [Acidobacteria bacterium]|nr:class I SAM-dependent methyltransferase [Acidobacteriota bacterium]